MRFHFPHASMRPGQEGFAMKVYGSLTHGSSLFVHAPTGSGKTASTLAPAISYAMRHGKKVMFLTSRHTQHDIALTTIRLLNESEDLVKEFKRTVRVADVIGKQSMCALTLPHLYGSDFHAFCKGLRENDKCEFYSNTKHNGNMTPRAKSVISQLDQMTPDARTIKEYATNQGVCPYEIAMRRVEDADVVIADYNHLFSPKIREVFLAKARVKLEELIVIADEAHNLPARIRGIGNARLSKFILDRAVLEAQEFCEKEGEHEIERALIKLGTLFSRFSSSFGKEDMIMREAVMNVTSKVYWRDHEAFIAGLEEVAQFTRGQERPSFCATIASFYDAWSQTSDGLLHMVSRDDGGGFAFSVRSLDPAIVADPVVNRSHAFIAISGTLQPIDMYARLLGADAYETLIVENPFPEENRMDVIVADATTKYGARSADTYRTYARTIGKMCRVVPGNVVVFCPSYALIESIASILESSGGKKVLLERKGMTHAEKKMLISEFKRSHMSGAVLFAVVSGSFGEGIDLPGDLLRAVMVVGLPFEAPDLETKQLIEYYDRKFGRGWDYGYIYPAFNRIFQNAGRLIRTPTDRGIVAFLDERYAWSRYRSLLGTMASPTIFPSADGSFEETIRGFYST